MTEENKRVHLTKGVLAYLAQRLKDVIEAGLSESGVGGLGIKWIPDGNDLPEIGKLSTIYLKRDSPFDDFQFYVYLQEVGLLEPWIQLPPSSAEIIALLAAIENIPRYSPTNLFSLGSEEPDPAVTTVWYPEILTA